jgi:hypothetical protein
MSEKEPINEVGETDQPKEVSQPPLKQDLSNEEIARNDIDGDKTNGSG